MTIEVCDEPAYRYDSADNIFYYSKQHFCEFAQEHPNSKHGVKIIQDDEIINSCIIIGSGGSTGIYQNSSLVDNDQLVVCCCDTIVCLSLPDLELKWKTKADSFTCFELFTLEDDYIVHGELLITRLDKNGKIKWEFGGTDIFVSLDATEGFRLEKDYIMLTDFGKTQYKIDFEGKLLSDKEQAKYSCGKMKLAHIKKRRILSPKNFLSLVSNLRKIVLKK